MKRLTYIDFIETFAIFCVVYCHFVEGAGTSALSNVILQFTTTFAVPAFFMANGTLLFLKEFNLEKHLEKCLLIFTSSVVWKLAYLFVIIVKQHFYFGNLTVVSVLNYLCGGNLLDPYVPAEHFWFIYALLGVYLLFPLLKSVYDDKKFNILKFLSAFLFVFVFICAEWNFFVERYSLNIFNLTSLKAYIFPFAQGGSYLLFFILGPFIHERYYEKKVTVSNRVKLSLAAVSGFSLLVLEKYFQEGTLSSNWVRLSDDYQHLGVLLMVVAIYALAASTRFTHTKFLEFVSARTMNIYCIHMMLCYIWNLYILKFISYSSVPMHILRTLIIVAMSILLTEPFTYAPVLRVALGLKPIRKKRN